MSLKPKRVDFTQTWEALQETVKCVITLSYVPRATWYDRFRYFMISFDYFQLFSYYIYIYIAYFCIYIFFYFSDVYSLCVAYPEPLADQLYCETKRFLDNHVFQLLTKVRAQGESSLLQAYHQAWTEYSQGINYLHRLYLYLNQQHIKKQKLSEAELIYGMSSATVVDCQEQMEIGELGLDIWKTRMITPLRKQLVSLLLENIHADRVGTSPTASTEVICGVIQSFVRVEEYKMKGQVDVMIFVILFHFFLICTCFAKLFYVVYFLLDVSRNF